MQERGERHETCQPDVDAPNEIADQRHVPNVEHAFARLGGMRMGELRQVDAGQDEDDEPDERDSAQGVPERVGVVRNRVAQAQRRPAARPAISRGRRSLVWKAPELPALARVGRLRPARVP